MYDVKKTYVCSVCKKEFENCGDAIVHFNKEHKGSIKEAEIKKVREVTCEFMNMLVDKKFDVIDNVGDKLVVFLDHVIGQIYFDVCEVLDVDFVEDYVLNEVNSVYPHLNVIDKHKKHNDEWREAESEFNKYKLRDL